MSISFSVCVPVFNGRALLGETLASVAQQTHADWELVVVEDGSTAPCRDIVETFAREVRQPVRYVVNPVNIGLARTRERLVELAARDHIAWLDADDLWYPSHLADMARVFERRDAELVFAGFEMFGVGHEDRRKPFVPGPEHCADLRLAYFMTRYWLQPSSVAIHRKIFDRVGPWSRGLAEKEAFFGGGRDMSEDRNFFQRSIVAGVEPAWTGGLSVGYRRHAESMSSKDRSAVQHRAFCANKIGPLRDRPWWMQRVQLSRMNAIAANECRATHPSRAAYFRSWRWRPSRLDHLALALILALRGRRGSLHA